MTLDNAQHSEVPLRKELEFIRCTMEIEKIHNPDSPSIQFQISTNFFDWAVPNRSIQAAVEAILKRDHPESTSPGQLIVEAQPEDENLLVHIHDSRPLRDSIELELLQTTLSELNEKREQEIQEPQEPISTPLKRCGIIVGVWSGLAIYFFIMNGYEFAAKNKPIPW